MIDEPESFGHNTRARKKHSIHVGGKSWQLLPDEILNFCWNSGLDTPCFLCNADFDIAVAPPVRTVRLYHVSGAGSIITRDTPSLEILNSHLECMKQQGVEFFPISHAWHTPVADAYASRTSNSGASKIILGQPLEILLSLAANRRFGNDVQIWHDYISIPQWQDGFRGTSILPQIFKIFQLGKTALLHMDQELNLHALEVGDREEVMKLFSARWFTRLWPVVELNMCEDAFIMNRANEISKRPLRSLVPALQTSLSITGTTIPPWVHSKIPTTCLGHIYDIIAPQGSRWYRDRFIAACTILEPDNYPSILHQLPTDSGDACLWLSKRCLERGDFSPLLLRPCVDKNERRNEVRLPARWLKGYERMDTGMWGLGPQTNSSMIIPKIIGNVVEVHLSLIGTIVKRTDEYRQDYNVYCEICHTRTACSIEFWQEIKERAHLYHIPGLLYNNTGADCIGMVVEGEQVIGRSKYAPPLCHCKRKVLVRLT